MKQKTRAGYWYAEKFYYEAVSFCRRHSFAEALLKYNRLHLCLQPIDEYRLSWYS